MNRILHFSILLVCFTRITAMESNVTKHRPKLDPRIKRPRFRPSMAEVERLIPLAAEISQFVATYDRPAVTKPHAFKFVHWRKNTRSRVVTEKTKYMTKRRYYTKKPYPLHSERRTIMYQHFINTLSLFDKDKKEHLLAATNEDATIKSTCYMNVYTTFMNYCHYEYFVFGGMTKMKRLLAGACMANWLTTDKIVRILRRCCQSRFKYEHIKKAVETA